MRFFSGLLSGLVLLLSGCATSSMLEERGVSADVLQNVAIVGVAEKLLQPSMSDMLLYGMVYLIYDPVAPNWTIEQVRIDEDTFRLQLRMKRYHTGGDGEAIMVLKRRAEQIQQEMGYSSYAILEYYEGIESETVAARRFGRGQIQLLGRLAAAAKTETIQITPEVAKHEPHPREVVVTPVPPPTPTEQQIK